MSPSGHAVVHAPQPEQRLGSISGCRLKGSLLVLRTASLRRTLAFDWCAERRRIVRKTVTIAAMPASAGRWRRSISRSGFMLFLSAVVPDVLNIGRAERGRPGVVRLVAAHAVEAWIMGRVRPVLLV